ncbi:MAG: hypothetical protein KatS3mg129_0207 [Leptospiraceae bacterium]|nr:MAG: hypothetical protein KatS3mg129_0207 [Leptospiraceae bacterium]
MLFLLFLPAFFALTFIYSFLNLNNYPIIKKIYLYFNYIGSIIFILLLFLPTRIYNQYTNILTLYIFFLLFILLLIVF